MEHRVGRSKAPGPNGTGSKTILIVEDEILIRLDMADGLIGAGFTVMQAANAEEALKVLHASMPVDLLVTDIRMPGSMDGLDLAAYARTQWPLLKIALMTAHLLSPPFVVDLFFDKPCVNATVIACIRQLLGSDDKERQSPMVAG